MARYKPPSPEIVAAAARRVGLSLTSEAAAMFARYGTELAFAYHRVDDLEEYLPQPNPAERTFTHPTAGENQFGAWLVKSSIRRAVVGKLTGKRIAVKDTVAVAGLPMTDGTDFLAHVPAFDATIVSRILDAGGEIAGKAVCEFLSYSSGSHTAVSGPVKNPAKPGYSTGGSSSGSAALVAAREIDMAIGGDQAGSIRSIGGPPARRRQTTIVRHWERTSADCRLASSRKDSVIADRWRKWMPRCAAPAPNLRDWAPRSRQLRCRHIATVWQFGWCSRWKAISAT
jgi:hypothetical protein